MKKLYYLIVLTLILGLVLTGCLLSNVGQVPTTEQSGITYLTKAVESDPFVTMLFAGQDIPVGTVSVWNDDVELHVTYNTTGGWVLAETHLAVVTNPALFPMTKTGNPKVGKFPYGAEDLIEFDSYGNIIGPYIYDETILFSTLGGTHEDIFYIAAHAVVADTSSIKTETRVSEPGVAVYGPLVSYYGLEDGAWGDSSDAVATWVHPSWPSIPGATWISTALYTEDPVYDSWRWFHDEITLPERGYYISGSVVLATSDNAEEVYFNGDLVGSDGEVQGPFIDDYEWGTIVEYPISPQPGLNTLDFIVRNYYQAGGSAISNPTGLIYKASASYYPKETAWAAYGEEPGEIPFPGNNWATYFTYFEPILIEEITVPSDDPTVVESINTLESGKNYELEVIGTWMNGTTRAVDAEYISDDGWTTWFNGPSWDERNLDLQVNEGFVYWGDYSDLHIYTLNFSGEGSTINFRVFDGNPVTNTPTPGWYGDNSGSLIVNIYELP